jgi:hypothetical protein
LSVFAISLADFVIRQKWLKKLQIFKPIAFFRSKGSAKVGVEWVSAIVAMKIFCKNEGFWPVAA